MKIFIGSDHAGFELKQKILEFLFQQSNFTNLNGPLDIKDLGTHDLNSVDYPDFANLVSQELKEFKDGFGILVCGSGQGVAMRANKFEHVRAALVYNSEIAKLSREHNDANIICLGARFCTVVEAQEWIKLFLTTPFAGGRHATRVAKVSAKVDYK